MVLFLRINICGLYVILGHCTLSYSIPNEDLQGLYSRLSRKFLNFRFRSSGSMENRDLGRDGAMTSFQFRNNIIVVFLHIFVGKKRKEKKAQTSPKFILRVEECSKHNCQSVRELDS